MSSNVVLNVKQLKKGPTLRLTLAASSYHGASDATSETFTIDGIALVRVKVNYTSQYPQYEHHISISAMKHESVKDDAISINVTCNALKYSKKQTCCDTWSNWIVIGYSMCSNIQLHNVYNYLSVTVIVITVHNMAKPGFPKLYADSDLTDFTLSTSDGNVAVHKAFLAAHSPVFKAMFTGTWKESKENIIEIKGYTRQTIQHMKDFLYLGTLPDDGLRPLITLAALYSINDLTKECARKLAETVEPEDFYSLHELACANNIPELSYALSFLTKDEVVDKGHQIKKKKDENEIEDEKLKTN